MLVYLASPVDQARGEQIEKWRTRAKEHLAQEIIFDPAGAWSLGSEVRGLDSRLQIGNLLALDQADAMLCWLPKGVPSVGVPMEIQHASSRSKPVAVMGPENSWALHASQYIKVFNGDDFEGAISWLRAEVNGRAGANLAVPEALKGAFSLQPYRPGFAPLPTRSHNNDAGYDLYITQTVTVNPGDFADLPHNLKVSLPYETWGMILGRSSTIRKRGLLVHTGVIDGGYRGELYTGVTNLRKEPVLLQAGERVSQLILIPLIANAWPPHWGALSDTDRGEGGFGSSGI